MTGNFEGERGRKRKRELIHLLSFAALLAVGCGEESPTDVGGSLLPGQPVRTFEVILEPDVFLVRDTAFSGYARIQNSGFYYLAESNQGVVNARGLARFVVPGSISVRDSAGTVRTDTLPIYFSGRLVLRVDTARSGPAPINVRGLRTTETWDPGSTTWQLRVDSGGVQEPWATPGGSPGALIDTASYVAGSDTVVIPLDSALIAEWRDTANVVAGAVFALGTAGAQLRVSEIVARLDARSTINRDTVVTTNIPATSRGVIFDPPLGETTSSAPRIGGLPAWRTLMEFRTRLDTLSVLCPDGAAGCRVRLSKTAVTHAALLMQPTAPPPGYATEDSVQIGARLLLVDPLAPLNRTPLGDVVGLMERSLPRSRVLDPGAAPVEVPITDFIRMMTRDSSEITDRPGPYIALIAVSEGNAFGFASFEAAPRLRLVLTVATELQLR